MRLITSEVVEGEENTIVLRGYYYDGYDIKIKFTRNKVLDPLIEMKQQLCASTGEAFGTIHGNGKLLMSQPTQYVSYYSTCEKFIFQYTTLSVRQQRRLALRGCRYFRQHHRMDQRSRMGKIKRTRILTFKTIQL